MNKHYIPIQKDRERLQNPYAHLNHEGNLEAIILYPARPRIDPAKLFGWIPHGLELTDFQIERIARNLLNQLWSLRLECFPDGDSKVPLNIRDPETALMSIGFQVKYAENLGNHFFQGARLGVAGLIDRPESTVWVSKEYPLNVRNFTMAHELGHALLHKSIVQHRDRPLDRAPDRTIRTQMEWEADKLATHFLMPKKQVRTEFEKRFQTRKFIFDETAAFAMGISNFDTISRIRNSRRELSRLLATTKKFHLSKFQSLSELFEVSSEAMAIRIEELNLV